ncbi:MAG: hypothetical protein HY208_07765, partial [Nitrospirae bacterium]|nr:hypothetical protein [Nitrospirota bacterium]
MIISDDYHTPLNEDQTRPRALWRENAAPYNDRTMTRRTMMGVAGIAAVIALAVAGLARWGVR